MLLRSCEGRGRGGERGEREGEGKPRSNEAAYEPCRNEGIEGRLSLAGGGGEGKRGKERKREREREKKRERERDGVFNLEIACDVVVAVMVMVVKANFYSVLNIWNPVS